MIQIISQVPELDLGQFASRGRLPGAPARAHHDGPEPVLRGAPHPARGGTPLPPVHGQQILGRFDRNPPGPGPDGHPRVRSGRGAPGKIFTDLNQSILINRGVSDVQEGSRVFHFVDRAGERLVRAAAPSDPDVLPQSVHLLLQHRHRFPTGGAAGVKEPGRDPDRHQGRLQQRPQRHQLSRTVHGTSFFYKVLYFGLIEYFFFRLTTSMLIRTKRLLLSRGEWTPMSRADKLQPPSRWCHGPK